jgi:pimeloyl-ACP methyl ester carboxylesterase
VPTFRDYTKPLLDILDSLPPGEKVVLVGHSLGGMNIALASELFPEKVAAAVFLAAFMPDHMSRPSHVLDKVQYLCVRASSFYETSPVTGTSSPKIHFLWHSICVYVKS